MAVCRTFMSTKERNSQNEKILKAGRILYDLFLVGPWRINTAWLERLKEPFDFASTDNILKMGVMEDKGANAAYIYRNCDDKIFVIWNQKQANIDFDKFDRWINDTFKQCLKKFLQIWRI